jgi:hypothetical protein
MSKLQNKDATANIHMQYIMREVSIIAAMMLEAACRAK